MLATYEHPDWWVRRHAIEATWLLFSRTYASYGEDIGETWTAMKQEIIGRRAEVESLLTERLEDPDADVRASAARARSCLDGCPPEGNDQSL